MTAVVFPFDLFGSGGTAAGAQLLGDALQEMLDDAKAETMPARARAYRDVLTIEEVEFETIDELQDWRSRGRKAFRAAAKDGPLLWVGGNHLSSLPVLEELGPKTTVVQFDAHLDVYNLADNTKELSHGNFLLHAAKPLPPIVHVGSRDLFLPADHARKHFREIIDAEAVAVDESAAVERLVAATGPRVWVDIDCDAFDPAFFPAVSHPQPFGLSPAFVLRCLSALGEKVTGMSLSEFDPGRDVRDQSLGTLVWLAEWLFLRWSSPTRNAELGMRK